MSTYSSLNVCRTPGRLHGIAGPCAAALAAAAVANDCFRGFDGPGDGDDVLEISSVNNKYPHYPKRTEIYIPWQAHPAQQLPHPPRHLHDLLQRIWLRTTHDPRIAHLGQKLRDDIVVRLELAREQRRSDELLQHIDHAVQELEDEQRIAVVIAGSEEEEIRMHDREDSHGRRGAGEVHEGGARVGVCEVEGEDGGCGGRAAAICML